MRKIAWILAGVMLVASLAGLAGLAGCSRRGEYEALYESQQIAESRRQETAVIEAVDPGETTYTGPFPSDRGYRAEVIHKDGEQGYYENKTEEELKQMFRGTGTVTESRTFLKLPTGCLICHSKLRGFYNKLSGNLSPLCPDPLCNDDECVWDTIMNWVYIDDTHQYFVAIDYEGSKTLYRSDVNRNHVEVILPNFEYGTVIHYAKGDTLYMTTLHYQENQAATSQFGIYDCKSQEFTPMKGFEDIDVVGVSDNQTLIYRKQVDSHQEYWKTDLSFVKPERMSELEDIIATAHPEACASNVVSQMVIISRPNITADKHLKPVILYHIETGKSMNLENIDHSSKLQFSGDYVYYTKSLTSSEMSASPHKDVVEGQKR